MNQPQGTFDGLQDGLLRGWFFSGRNVTASVVIEIDGRRVAIIPANESRPDLLSAFDSTEHGFAWPVPDVYRTGALHEVRIFVHGGDTELRNSPEHILIPARDIPAKKYLKDNIVAARQGARAKQHRDLAIFAVYEQSGQLQDFQKALLDALAGAGFDIII